MTIKYLFLNNDPINYLFLNIDPINYLFLIDGLLASCVLGRVFNGSGKPIDKGPNVMAEDYLDIQVSCCCCCCGCCCYFCCSEDVAVVVIIVSVVV